MTWGGPLCNINITVTKNTYHAVVKPYKIRISFDSTADNVEAETDQDTLARIIHAMNAG